MTEHSGSRSIPQRMNALPKELEARLAALEGTAPRADFDAWSWFWMVLLGAVLPAILLTVGWYT